MNFSPDRIYCGRGLGVGRKNGKGLRHNQAGAKEKTVRRQKNQQEGFRNVHQKVDAEARFALFSLLPGP